MSARKKSTRRNKGGRRNATPPPISVASDIASLEKDIAVTDMAMRVARTYSQNRWGY